ncbi:MAG: hypothetical protein RL758_1646, partial [Pseudomonadota bacterium]
RGYTSGFLERRPANDYQNYETGHSIGHRSQFVGEVQAVNGDWVQVETKNRFDVGDTLEIIHPSGNRKVVLSEMKSLDGQSISTANGSPLKVWIPLQGPAEGALLAKLY